MIKNELVQGAELSDDAALKSIALIFAGDYGYNSLLFDFR
jgi:hypothetical protein